MWEERENVVRCPECDVALVPLHQLPPSPETVLEREAAILQNPPEWQRRGLYDFGRGRGLLPLIALMGLAGFFQPWFVLSKPETLVLSGFQIARFYAGWLWAGAVGWFIVIPLVLSRRTIADLRGIRVISAFFASLTLGEILVLSNASPSSKVRVPVEFGWSYGLFWSALASIFGVIVAIRLGGSLPRRTNPERPEAKLRSVKAVRRSPNETLH